MQQPITERYVLDQQYEFTSQTRISTIMHFISANNIANLLYINQYFVLKIYYDCIQ